MVKIIIQQCYLPLPELLKHKGVKRIAKMSAKLQAMQNLFSTFQDQPIVLLYL